MLRGLPCGRRGRYRRHVHHRILPRVASARVLLLAARHLLSPFECTKHAVGVPASERTWRPGVARRGAAPAAVLLAILLPQLVVARAATRAVGRACLLRPCPSAVPGPGLVAVERLLLRWRAGGGLLLVLLRRDLVRVALARGHVLVDRLADQVAAVLAVVDSEVHLGVAVEAWQAYLLSVHAVGGVGVLAEELPRLEHGDAVGHQSTHAGDQEGPVRPLVPHRHPDLARLWRGRRLLTIPLARVAHLLRLPRVRGGGGGAPGGEGAVRDRRRLVPYWRLPCCAR